MVDDKNSNFNPNEPILKQVRERLGMTQEEFARELGMTRETIGRHERGVHRIRFTISQVQQLVELMEQAGLSIKDLPKNID
ncbi:MAG TPA: helix-turn-helix transcriptional regulator [Oculatellaceae cyanobacterium]|jgi:DNA-binding XRE family transcriptional regulator